MQPTFEEIQAFIREKDASGEAYAEADKNYLRSYEGGGQVRDGTAKSRQPEAFLFEFFTPEYVADLMWRLAYKHGFKAGQPVLEPSCANGRLLSNPAGKSPKVGFEVNELTARIAQILHPDAKIYNQYFETAFLHPPRFTSRIRDKNAPTWLDDYPFGLVIGNPPYGTYKNMYSSHFKTEGFKQIEIAFIHFGLELLKPGGLLVYLISSNFLRNSEKYNYAKDRFGKVCSLVDAYRLPPVFPRSQVPTDIMILKKND